MLIECGLPHLNLDLDQEMLCLESIDMLENGEIFAQQAIFDEINRRFKWIYFGFCVPFLYHLWECFYK
jgi:hypothetical protein